MEVRKCVGRRGIVKGAAAGVSAAGVLVAGGVGTKAQVPAAGFPLQKLADSPLVVDVSKIPGALLNEQIPRWVDPISFPQWLPPMATGSVPAAYGSPVGDVFHGVAPEWSNHPADWDRFPVQYYGLSHRPGRARFLPSSMNLATDFWGYAGRRADGTMMPTALPPTFRFRFGQPALVRVTNELPEEVSVHMHGGHNPAHADGHASFLVLPGKARDYYYPNVVPRASGGNSGPFDFSHAQSTIWYHDHAHHLTAPHVARGLGGGMALALDDLELGLIGSGVLPGIRGVSDVGPEYRNPYDLPLVIRDDIFDATGALRYVDNSHNGYLGNVARVNGQAYPFLRVERRKYRFRVLVASNARVWRFRLSDNSSFLRIGKDAWLFPRPQQTQCFLAGPATRADIVIDFSRYRPGQEIFLENILPQKDPRGPGDKLEDVNGTTVVGTPPYRHRVLKFVVGDRDPRFPDATITPTSPLRPHVPIADAEIVARRTFLFERKNGAWAINGQFWNPDIVNAIPKLGSAEEWTIKNGAGGWWHPIHLHLEGHEQVVNVNAGGPIPYHDRFKTETTMLGPNSEFKIRVRFRTFKGPFVFHCHAVEHEDQDMMFQFDPRDPVTASTTPQQWFP